MRRWLRQYFRSRTNPIARSYAAEMKHKLSAMYTFAAYNALGILLAILLFQYYPMTKKEKKQPGRYYARLFQDDNATVYRLEGLRLHHSYHITSGQPDPSDLKDETTTADNSELLTD